MEMAKNRYRKFETNIPRKGVALAQSQFTHIFPRMIRLFCCRKYVDRSWEYIYCSQIHKCGNWDWGRAIPIKGIHKWDFRLQCKLEKYWQFLCGLVQASWPEAEVHSNHRHHLLALQRGVSPDCQKTNRILTVQISGQSLLCAFECNLKRCKRAGNSTKSTK
jgi:hypothetical protein